MPDWALRIRTASYSEFRRIPLPKGVVLITSALSREGKTFIATSLAIAQAYKLGTEKPVLFVDLNTFNREGGAILARDPNLPGVANILRGRASYEACIQATPVPNLFVLPFGVVPDGFIPMTYLGALQILIQRLSRQYQIIIDGVPVFLRNRNNFDPVELSLLAEGTVLIVLAGKTPYEVIAKSRQDIENMGGTVVGVIMNDRFVRSFRSEIAGYLRWFEKIPVIKHPIGYLRARLGIY